VLSASTAPAGLHLDARRCSSGRSLQSLSGFNTRLGVLLTARRCTTAPLASLARSIVHVVYALHYCVSLSKPTDDSDRLAVHRPRPRGYILDKASVNRTYSHSTLQHQQPALHAGRRTIVAQPMQPRHASASGVITMSSATTQSCRRPRPTTYTYMTLTMTRIHHSNKSSHQS